MKDIALFVGNDINNIELGISWKDLLNQIIAHYNLTKKIVLHANKPFPLLYEEIFMQAIENDHIKEASVKEYIGQKISDISSNEIHDRIKELGVKNIITTNYDYTLEGNNNLKNSGIIDERLYSIFRKTVVGKTNYWHIHGEANVPMSINLGYEHYGGQLQHMRNYVVSGTNYASKKVHKKPLIRRIKEKMIAELDMQSWIDLFFSRDIHIFGIGLDFIEIDLWWLITYRARMKLYKGSSNISNNIYYYTPTKYLADAASKIELMKVNDISIIDFNIEDKKEYYNHVIDTIVKK